MTKWGKSFSKGLFIRSHFKLKSRLGRLETGILFEVGVLLTWEVRDRFINKTILHGKRVTL